MSLRINLNTAALNAHRQLQATDQAEATSIERLSSGYRINRAADDPAGLAISENLRSQVAGLGQAMSNSSDAVNMVKSAEGALSEVHNLLRTMRNLALHASNTGTTDDTARAADQTQIQSNIAALNRIAQYTQFGNKKLLDGSAGISGTVVGATDAKFVSGSTATVGGTYTATIAANVTAALASQAGGAGGAAAGADVLKVGDGVTLKTVTFVAADSLAVQATKINAQTNSIGIYAEVSAGGIKLTNQFGGNVHVDATSDAAALADTGLTATDSTAVAGQGDATHAVVTGGTYANTTAGGGTISINGVATAAIANADTIDNVITKINAIQYQSGVTASKSGGKIVLTQQYQGSNNKVTVAAGTMSVADLAKVGFAQGTASGRNAVYATKATATSSVDLTNAGVAQVGSFKLNNVEINVTAADTWQTITNKINNVSDQTGVTATAATSGGTITLTQADYGSAKKIVLADVTANQLSTMGLAAGTITGSDVTATVKDALNNTLSVTTAGSRITGGANTDIEGLVLDVSATSAGTATTRTFTVTNDSLRFQIGANAGQTSRQGINGVAADKLGVSATGLSNSSWTSIADVDLRSYAGAQDTIKLLDAAITEVSSMRSELGSFQKNLESNISSLGVAKENIAASESTIRDADMAAEMVTFTRNQILMQAGTAMLTQANQAPQALLSLLK